MLIRSWTCRVLEEQGDEMWSVCISFLRNHLWNVARLQVPFCLFSLLFSNINCLFPSPSHICLSRGYGEWGTLILRVFLLFQPRTHKRKCYRGCITIFFLFFYICIDFKWVLALTVFVWVRGKNQNTRAMRKKKSSCSKKAKECKSTEVLYMFRQCVNV